MVQSPVGMSLSAAAGRVGSSAIRDLLAVADREDVISLAGGMPAPEAFPAHGLAAAIAEILLSDPAGALQYSSTEGYLPLRAWIAAEYDAAPDRVLVTSVPAGAGSGGAGDG